jgi:Arylsulfotransferase (ASST).
MRRKKLFLLGIIPLILLILVGCSNSSKDSEVLSTAQIKKNIGSKLISTREDAQKKLTKKYQSATKNKSYTLSDPYVKVNPYKDSPLTALVIFKTDKAAKVSYTVTGKTDKTSITNQVKGYQKTHQVPIAGLYADYNNTVTMTITYKDGTTEQKVLHLQTEELPKYIKNAKIKVSKNDKSKMDIGDNKLTLMNRTTKEPFAIDADGEVRWYSTNYSQHTIEQTVMMDTF